MNHQFERRIGVWRAGLDEDGELFCNQRYGDWPRKVTQGEFDPWADPEWYLLSYQKCVRASSFTEGHEPGLAVNENVRNWWQAQNTTPGEWLETDLGKCCEIHAVQINFADDKQAIQEAFNDEAGEKNKKISVKAERAFQSGPPAISGLRIFGKAQVDLPEQPQYQVERCGDLDMQVSVESKNAIGYNILWGKSPEKLYHSYLTYNHVQRIGALEKGKAYYVRVDAFNEAGITKGEIVIGISLK